MILKKGKLNMIMNKQKQNGSNGQLKLKQTKQKNGKLKDKKKENKGEEKRINKREGMRKIVKMARLMNNNRSANSTSIKNKLIVQLS